MGACAVDAVVHGGGDGHAGVDDGAGFAAAESPRRWRRLLLQRRVGSLSRSVWVVSASNAHEEVLCSAGLAEAITSAMGIILFEKRVYRTAVLRNQRWVVKDPAF